MALRDWINKAEEEERKNREAEERRQQARKEIPVEQILNSVANKMYDGMCQDIAKQLISGNTASGWLKLPENAHSEEISNDYIPLVKEERKFFNMWYNSTGYTYIPQPAFARFWKMFQSLAQADGITVEAKIERISKKTKKNAGYVEFGSYVFPSGCLFTPACTARPVILYTYTK